jgi:SAM-dependent methyltransferase
MTAVATGATPKPDYGVDAPIFQRAALIGGLLGVVVGRTLIDRGQLQSLNWAVQLGLPLMSGGVSFFVVGCISLWGSKFGKLHLRDKILNSIEWRGNEQVLDVGCGHGLMLLGAAKRLSSGHATGIDVWSQVDQGNNSAEATLENARREGVFERVEIKNADARELPFAENSFDVILSSFVIHNISGAAERERAIREIARVLKPGGQLALADIRHTSAYVKTLRSLGWKPERWGPNFLFVTPTRVIRATKP